MSFPRRNFIFCQKNTPRISNFSIFNLKSNTMKKVFKFLLLFLLPVSAFAQIPIIEVPSPGGKYTQIPEVSLQSLTTEVKVAGGISTTVQTMVFKNNADRILEGRLTFPLPENVSISGYALDINGKLRQAVPVEKEKAKEVFESIEKRNIDPGLIEKVEGNNFRTRIYPFLPHQTRTVQITYHMQLKKSAEGLTYYLPLDYKKTIPEFSLNVQVNESLNTPKLTETPDGSFTFVKSGNVWSASISKTNYQPQANLRLTLPPDNSGISTVMQRASGNNYYFLSKVDVPGSTRPKPAAQEISLVWDNSLSGLQRDHEKEFALLDAYFKNTKNLRVHLHWLSNTFDGAGSFTITKGNWAALKNALQNATYDGGTDFSILKNVVGSEVLFFTDGISSFGDLVFPWRVPVYPVASSARANFSQMKGMAAKTGGEFVNLNELTSAQALTKIVQQPFKFLGIKNSSAVSEVYPSLPVAVDENFSVAGIANGNQNAITLLFGYGNTPTLEKTIQLNSDKQVGPDWEIGQFWAQNRISELEMMSGSEEEIRNLGRQFGIVTKNTSLMVLENVSDYVRYKIDPPAELREEYNRLTKENRQNLEENRQGIMEDAIAMMATLKEWYAKDFSIKKKYPKPERDRASRMEDMPLVVNGIPPSSSSPPTQASPPSPPMESRAREARANVVSEAADAKQMVDSSSALRVISVVRTTSRSVQAAAPGKINTVEVKSDAEYMKFFEKKNAGELYAVYLKERAPYLSSPRYYMDVAQLLYRAGQKDLALKVLSSVADLDLENEEVYKLLGYKLKEMNQYAKEQWAFRKVMEWRPFDPQSLRDYALASEDNGHPQEALDHLYKILTKTYGPEMARRDGGIEETILMEMNQLISRHPNLKTSSINPKLIADMPVNIRVVLNWNHDDTDIDLWVTDPNGEKCMYNHSETEIGGRLSNDFTGGFGPEQFLLKKAIKGKYKIETNFYNESRISVSGPTAIMAEIFINYATGRQERKIVVFQNQEEKDTTNRDGVFIGEFEF